MTRTETDALGKLMLFGTSGRISDIIGKVGYRKLVKNLEQPDHQKNSAENIELLHKYTGWMLDYLGRKH
jgi:dissimilatory sulfite reductase (desulfoviridin) alpha/beta subunit